MVYDNSFYALLEIESRASNMLDKWSATDSHPTMLTSKYQQLSLNNIRTYIL